MKLENMGEANIIAEKIKKIEKMLVGKYANTVFMIKNLDGEEIQVDGLLANNLTVVLKSMKDSLHKKFEELNNQ